MQERGRRNRTVGTGGRRVEAGAGGDRLRPGVLLPLPQLGIGERETGIPQAERLGIGRGLYTWRLRGAGGQAPGGKKVGVG